MNTLTLIPRKPLTRVALTVAGALAAAVMAAGTAYAQEGDPMTWLDQAKSTKTRAEVLAELKQAQKDGTMHAWDSTYEPTLTSTKTRAEVRAETIRAMHDGTISALSDDSLNWLNPASTARAAGTTAAGE